MNKYIAWNEDSGMALTINSIKDLIPLPFRHGSLELYQSTGKTDIHGNEIYYDFHIVKFKFHDPQLKKTITCIGAFSFNVDELRAEIDIYKNPHMPCLWYMVDDMTDFKIIGNVKENPELIGEGK